MHRRGDFGDNAGVAPASTARRVNPMVVCPRCGAADIESLGRVRSTLDWHQCRLCHYVWPEREPIHGPSLVGDADGPVACARCGKIEARVIGRTTEVEYLQCMACAHTSVRPAAGK